MEKLLKNIHWFIILWALVNIGLLVKDSDEKISEINSQQEVQRQNLQKAKKTRKEIMSFYKDIDEAKGRIERVAREIEKAQQLLPSETSDTETINLLRKMAQEVNIKELLIVPDNDMIRDFYIARRYKFSAKATYLQFLIMFEKISESKRILNVTDLYFKKMDLPQRGKYQLINGEFTLEAYRFNPNYKEDRGIERIENEFKNEQKTPAVKGQRPPHKAKAEE